MGRTSHTLGTLLPATPENKCFCGYFGVSAEVMVEAWEMMEELDCLPPLPRFQHYLLVLAFMQLYPANGSALSSTLGEWPKEDPKIYLAYDPVTLWFGGSGGELTVRVLPYQLIPLTVPLCQILFEHRKVEDVRNDCLLSVNGTDFRVAKSYEKPYYSYKFKKWGFHYKVALCIKTGDICWWVGPYLPGIWNDNMIFQDGLVHFWRRGRGVRWMMATKAVLRCMQNALESLRQTWTRQRCSRGCGACLRGSKTL